MKWNYRLNEDESNIRLSFNIYELTKEEKKKAQKIIYEMMTELRVLMPLLPDNFDYGKKIDKF